MKSTKRRFWRIECWRGVEKFYEDTVGVKHISDKNIAKYLKVLMYKYALDNNEILEEFMRRPFKKAKAYVNISETNQVINDYLHIVYSAHIADISIDITLCEDK